jgi:hypothetical protein
MAALDDDDEFNEYATFIKAQWRNVRKRKMLGSDGVDGDREKGAKRVRVDDNTASGDSGAEEKVSEHARGWTEEEEKGSPPPRPRVSSDSDMDELPATQIAEVELSQANSLYSHEVGDLPPPHIEELRLPVHRQLVVDTSVAPGEDLGISGQGMVETGAAEGEHGGTEPAARINLNLTAPKTGRPKTSRADIVAAKKV